MRRLQARTRIGRQKSSFKGVASASQISVVGGAYLNLSCVVVERAVAEIVLKSVRALSQYTVPC